MLLIGESTDYSPMPGTPDPESFIFHARRRQSQMRRGCKKEKLTGWQSGMALPITRCVHLLVESGSAALRTLETHPTLGNVKKALRGYKVQIRASLRCRGYSGSTQPPMDVWR